MINCFCPTHCLCLCRGSSNKEGNVILKALKSVDGFVVFSRHANKALAKKLRIKLSRTELISAEKKWIEGQQRREWLGFKGTREKELNVFFSVLEVWKYGGERKVVNMGAVRTQVDTTGHQNGGKQEASSSFVVLPLPLPLLFIYLIIPSISSSTNSPTLHTCCLLHTYHILFSFYLLLSTTHLPFIICIPMHTALHLWKLVIYPLEWKRERMERKLCDDEDLENKSMSEGEWETQLDPTRRVIFTL